MKKFFILTLFLSSLLHLTAQVNVNFSTPLMYVPGLDLLQGVQPPPSYSYINNPGYRYIGFRHDETIDNFLNWQSVDSARIFYSGNHYLDDKYIKAEISVNTNEKIQKPFYYYPPVKQFYIYDSAFYFTYDDLAENNWILKDVEKQVIDGNKVIERYSKYDSINYLRFKFQLGANGLLQQVERYLENPLENTIDTLPKYYYSYENNKLTYYYIETQTYYGLKKTDEVYLQYDFDKLQYWKYREMNNLYLEIYATSDSSNYLYNGNGEISEKSNFHYSNPADKITYGYSDGLISSLKDYSTYIDETGVSIFTPATLKRYAYNAENKVDSIFTDEHDTASGSFLPNYVTVVNYNGDMIKEINIYSNTEDDAWENDKVLSKYDYTYDAQNRLVQADVYSLAGNGTLKINETFNYAYDDAGNLSFLKNVDKTGERNGYRYYYYYEKYPAQEATDDPPYLSFQVYPNPTNGFIFISLNSNIRGAKIATLTDMLGKAVLSTFLEPKDAGGSSIDVRGFGSGMYLLKVEAGEFSAVAKIIII